jgi:hypothetical protein
MKKLITVLLLFSVVLVSAQTNTIAHFSVWKPKSGYEQNFENGYKKHLQWHSGSGDKWSWYGWYIISGPRAGYFVDATFNHSWADFDKPVDPVGDAADNILHTEPFGDFLFGFKVKYLPQLSIADGKGLQSNFLRLITLTVTDVEQGKGCIEKLKAVYQARGLKSFLLYELVDGGNLNRLLLLIGYSNFEEFGKTETIHEELSKIENSLKVKLFTEIISENLKYKPDMSLFPQQ